MPGPRWPRARHELRARRSLTALEVDAVTSNATCDKKLATAMVGSFPEPAWFTESLRGRPFKIAMGDSLIASNTWTRSPAYVNEQERAGIPQPPTAASTSKWAGARWFIERLGGAPRFPEYAEQPATSYEVQEAYHPPAVTGKISRGPLHYSALWKTAQRMTSKPVKFGAISATCLPMMLWNEYYKHDQELTTTSRRRSTRSCANWRRRDAR